MLSSYLDSVVASGHSYRHLFKCLLAVVCGLDNHRAILFAKWTEGWQQMCINETVTPAVRTAMTRDLVSGTPGEIVRASHPPKLGAVGRMTWGKTATSANGRSSSVPIALSSLNAKGELNDAIDHVAIREGFSGERFGWLDGCGRGANDGSLAIDMVCLSMVAAISYRGACTRKNPSTM
jgi:hypothetical protein